MKLLKLLPLMGVVLAANVAFATPESDWNRLLASYNKLQKAKNTKAMTTFVNTHFIPEFKFIKTDGRALTRDGFLQEEMDMLYAVKEFSKCQVTISGFSAKGDNATSSGRFHFAGTMKPMNGKKGGKLVVNGTFKAKFVRQNGKWLMAEVKETASKATVDGKPMMG